MPVRLPRGKVQLNIIIDEKVANELYNLVKIKYQGLKGGLSYEVEEALKNWLALHAQNARKNGDPERNPYNGFETVEVRQNNLGSSVGLTVPSKVHQAFDQVKEYLRTKYGYEFFPGQQVHFKLLREAIAATRGSDGRTIERWLNTFSLFGLIKPISPNVWEIL